MTTASVATLVHESLGERVYNSLRDLILSQAYPPRSKLNVEQFCGNLGGSRTPVSDVMRRLGTKGLVAPERLASSVAEHGAIFAAVAAGDADRAEHVSRAHSDHVHDDALDFTNRAEPSPGFVGVHTAPGTAQRGRVVSIEAAPSGRR